MLQLTYQLVHEQSARPSFKAGALGQTEDGRIWKYLQASEALSQGSVVTKMNSTGIVLNADVDAAAAADTRRVTATSDFTTTALTDTWANSAANEDIRRHGHTYYLWIDAGDAQGQGGIIYNRVSDDAVDVYWRTSNDGKISTALSATSDYVVIVHTRVELTDAATDLATAVAQSAVTDEYWFWGLVNGPGVVLLDTSENPVQSDDLALIPASNLGANGYAQGTTGTATTAELAAVFARTFGDQDADGLIHANINCLWTDPYFEDSIPLPENFDWQYPRLR